MGDYLNNILARHSFFENEEVIKYTELVTLDSSEINYFRIKSKIIARDIEALKSLKNVSSHSEVNDYISAYLIKFKSDKIMLIAVFDPQELYLDASVVFAEQF